MAFATIPTAPSRASPAQRACRKRCSTCEFVQENGPEKIEEKLAIFALLDKLAPPNALLVSSTSAITASRFTEALPGRARCLVGHPVNPPHLVPLVELCGAPWTSPEAIDRARNIYREIGQVPVTINREINGFVLNRLQGALLAEAFRLVGEGYISAEDLDHTVKDGLGLRWSFLGPFETIELNAPGGIPDYCARYTGFYKELASAAAGPEVYQSPNVDRVIAAWPHQPTAGADCRADTAAQRTAGGAGRPQGQAEPTNP